MRRTMLRAAILLSVAGCGQLFAVTGEIRTPLTRFPFHFPLKYVDDWVWSFNTFASCYHRSADKAFDACDGDIVPLAKLFFGKSEFRGEEAFFDGMIKDVGAPPALKYAKIHPRFKYQEKGVNFGAELEYRMEDDSKWRFGGQLSLPFKVIDAERNVCSATMTDQNDLEEQLSDVICRKDEELTAANGNTNSTRAIVPAYRLDFLTSLCRASGMPMVEYGDGWLRIAGIEVTHITGGAGAMQRFTVQALRNEDGTCPSDQYASPSISAGGIPGFTTRLDANFIGADGDIAAPEAADPNRAPFLTGTDYSAPVNLGGKRDAQGKLYIVPAYFSDVTQANGSNRNTLFTTEAVIIMNAIEGAIRDLEQQGVITAEQYFYNNDVHFCLSDRILGLGDLKLDLFVCYDFTEEFWGKFLAGIVFPTGKKLGCKEDVGELLAQPAGNNGHFEIMVGLQAGWKPSKWFALHADAKYNHVFGAKEWRAAPFKGATIKNIGPGVQVKTKWGYFTGHVDLTFFHPENQNLGFSLGYEGYLKRCDNICPCVTCGSSGDPTMAKELPLYSSCCVKPGGPACLKALNPKEKELDVSILAQNSKRVSHKIRGSVFHRWDYCEIFAGASRVVGGKNIMRESECHVGFGIYW